jgi:hypothetical protein
MTAHPPTAPEPHGRATARVREAAQRALDRLRAFERRTRPVDQAARSKDLAKRQAREFD